LTVWLQLKDKDGDGFSRNNPDVVVFYAEPGAAVMRAMVSPPPKKIPFVAV